MVKAIRNWWIVTGQWLLPRHCRVCGRVRRGKFVYHDVHGYICKECYLVH